ncbi:MAG: 4-hydroxybenzoate octaprenyltransferase [Halioglobus sp.]
MTSSKFHATLQLMRIDRPIGTLLLLWPTLWALWLANEGLPSLQLLLIFTAGTFLMRSAGCIVNDFADRRVDGAVARTANRPLVVGVISSREALLVFLVLAVASFALVLLTNLLTIQLSVVGIALAVAYPFMKRFTHLPQLVLGLAFSWGIPMAFAASLNALPAALWILVLANLLWTVVYDTKYAMVDREDDLVVGIKSTAILFGNADRWIIAALQVACLATLVWTGLQFDLQWPYYLSLVVVAALFGYHLYLIRSQDPAACFKAFKHNNWVGMTIFLGIAASYTIA